MRTLLLFCGLAAVATAAEEPTFQPLLDEKLSQWEKWLGVPHRSYEVPGYVRGATAKEDPREKLRKLREEFAARKNQAAPGATN